MNKRHIIGLLVLSALCFAPAIIIGFSNGGRINLETLSGPFKRIPAETGAAFVEKDTAKIPTPRATPVTSTDALAKKVIIEVPEVVIMGTTQSKTAPVVSPLKEDDDGSSAWTQDSLAGGTVKITGFQPGE